MSSKLASAEGASGLQKKIKWRPMGRQVRPRTPSRLATPVLGEKRMNTLSAEFLIKF